MCSRNNRHSDNYDLLKLNVIYDNFDVVSEYVKLKDYKFTQIRCINPCI